MAVRLLLAAALLSLAASGCGGSEESTREVRLLAPPWIEADVARFERVSGCRVDLRVYDEGEDLAAIAKRRDTDVIASPVPPGGDADQSEAFVHINLRGGVEVTVPQRLASAFSGRSRPAGQRAIAWRIRDDGENGDCARRWLRYATSQDTSVSSSARNPSGS
jgi:hypothetical protein